MEVISLLGALTSTGLISIGVARFLSERLIDHRLSRQLKDYDADLSRRLASHQAELDRRLNDAKADVEARFKKEVEDYLGERSAERAYRSDARKRLYSAVGPLRFQLLVAGAEFANRVTRMGDGKFNYDTSFKRYFGQSTAYRLVRVLAISELIERQVAYADFAVDPAMRSLLKFKRQAFLCLSSHRVSIGHPRENWAQQQEHVFYDNLGIIASALIVQEGAGGSRVLRFDEFSALASDPQAVQDIEPIPGLFAGFSVQAKPILWLRLLALAELCVGLVEHYGGDLGLELEPLDSRRMMAQAQDAHIQAHLAEYGEVMTAFRTALQPVQG